ncbi:MAG: DAK2 domain-containing protein [Eubacteriales bacterium]|nr:DAK2 domain-containing protein [Eubacteriales bacterium]
MATTTIDAALVQKMFLAGAKNLESKKEWINDLNVFPVPDGDTGTNMTLTIMSAAKEVSAIANPTMESLAKAISTGSLRGARGNSGVILSQLLRGFTKEMSTTSEITVETLAAATQKATETAYKAVMKPKEGTILTVAKGISDKASEVALQTTDIEEAVSTIIDYAEEVLAKTPEMLPVLKEAGVVDSGGQGLVVVLRGMYDALTGKVTDFTITEPSAEFKAGSTMPGKGAAIDNADIKFGYCTEFIIMLDKEFNEKTEAEFKAFLSSIGDSIVCVNLDDIVKVHVHTNHPGQAFEKGLEYGQLTKMKVDNMREEHNQKVVAQSELQAAVAADAMKKKDAEDKKEEPKKDFGFITIAAGAGLADIFRGLGVDQVIEGGQTMNPSTEDILNAADKINAETIFVLPNNSNIILASNQAASIIEDKKLVVIPTKTIPQGITAMINFEMTRSAQENEEAMVESLSMVQSGQLTYAVRDTSIDGKEIKKDNYLGLGDKGLASVGTDMDDTLLEMLDTFVNEESELISLYYGSDVKEEDADELASKIEERFDGVDVEVQFGGQPVYFYIVSVE